MRATGARWIRREAPVFVGRRLETGGLTMPRALVTGGAGFLGSHVCDRLIAEGYEVLALDNLLTGSVENLAHLRREPRFDFARRDVTEALHVSGPVHFVFHMASPASPADYLEYPIETLTVGGLGTHRALDLSNEKGARFLLASTSEVYGDPAVHPQPEAYWGHVNPVGERSVYDEAKRYAEALTMAFRRKRRANTAIARIFNTYGPRVALNDGRVVPNFIGQALRGKPLTVYGDGEQTRSFCYVDDLVEGLFRLAVSREGEPINIGSPVEITIRELAERIRTLTGACSPIVFRPLPTADGPRMRRPEITRARALLNWEPKIDLAEGMRRTISWFRSRAASVEAEEAAAPDQPSI